MQMHSLNSFPSGIYEAPCWTTSFCPWRGSLLDTAIGAKRKISRTSWFGLTIT